MPVYVTWEIVGGGDALWALGLCLCYAIVLRRCDWFACGIQGQCDTGASWVLRVERVVELEAAEGPRPFFRSVLRCYDSGDSVRYSSTDLDLKG